MADQIHPIILGVTGASGSIYAQRLLQVLTKLGRKVELIESPTARVVLEQELPGATLDGSTVTRYAPDDFMAPPASGSHPTGGMVVCPCSAATLAAIATGCGSNLIHRAAEVHLKERRPLILVPRETPLSLTMIENMRAATLAGAVILPAMPGFYNRPNSIDELADFLVARICDQLGIDHGLGVAWEGEA